MDLIRDCLDKRIDDRFERRMGRVAYVELGVKTLINRLSIRFGNWISHLMESRHIEFAPYRIA